MCKTIVGFSKPFFLALLKRRIWLLCITALLSIVSNRALSSHALAGQITYQYVPNADGSFSNKYIITLTTYTNRCAANVDRCQLQFPVEIWGLDFNGKFVKVLSFPNLARINGPAGVEPGTNNSFCPHLGDFLRTIPGGGCSILSIYKTPVVTLPGDGLFEIRYVEQYRTANIRNMNNSSSQGFYLSTQLINNSNRGPQNSVQLLNNPVDDACTDRLWTHNPAAFDPDGDSLHYSLVTCKTEDPVSGVVSAVPGFIEPNLVDNPHGFLAIDSNTGLVTWKSPTVPGRYNISILVQEYRNRQIIGSVVRDMLIIVGICKNNPPEVVAIPDTCLTVGNTLSTLVKARDPDPGDSVYFYLNNGKPGGGDAFDHGATLTPPGRPANVTQLVQDSFHMPNPLSAGPTYPYQGTLTWTPGCEDVRSSTYQINYYAHDSTLHASGAPTLAGNAVTTIRVIPPGVASLSATAITNRSVLLNWAPVSCPNLSAYLIYRSSDSLANSLPACCDGTAGTGYKLIKILPKNRLTYTDGPGLAFQGRYCYRIVTAFVDSTSRDTVRSCPSPQACVELIRTFPVLLNNDVDSTDATQGRIKLRWRMPDTTKLTGFLVKPFTYKIVLAAGSGSPSLVTTPLPLGIWDTTYTLTGLNTATQAYTAQIQFLDASAAPNNLIGTSDPASSVYLNTTAGNKSAILNWNFTVPWENQAYDIYKGTSPSALSLLTTLSGPNLRAGTVTDTIYNLRARQRYYFYIAAHGDYNNPKINLSTLFNRSEISSVVPVDTIPPCPVISTVVANCDSRSATISWTIPPCGQGVIDSIYVYYKRFQQEPFPATPIKVVAAGSTSSYTYKDDQNPDTTLRYVLGCFQLVAVDSSGNRSKPTPTQCFGDTCVLFNLPNVFTPNGDGVNDRFIPLFSSKTPNSPENPPYSLADVRTIKCYIYDRWGKLLNTSTDKTNLWDGTVSGQPAVAGVYFYVVQVELQELQQNHKITRTGSVTLLR